MAKTSTFLFLGNDTWQSAQAVRGWEDLFVQKYGETTRHRVTPEHNDPVVFLSAVQTGLSIQPLFGEHVLVIVRRPTLFEKGKSQAFSKGLTEILTALRNQSQSATVVIWVDRDLPPSHPLLKWFQQAAEKNQAKIYHHQAPGNAALIGQMMKPLEAEGYDLDTEAAVRLDHYLKLVAKNQRVRERLRGTDTPAVDERRWWLRTCLENAALAADRLTITAAVIDEVADQIGTAFSPFEFTNALERSDLKTARAIVKAWEAQGNEAEFFALFSILGRFYRPQSRAEQQALPELLAEIELISKNTQLPLPAVTDLFLARLRDAKMGRAVAPILEPKKLWQALL